MSALVFLLIVVVVGLVGFSVGCNEERDEGWLEGWRAQKHKDANLPSDSDPASDCGIVDRAG
jgi:hypothetical protein